jgi:ribosomal protein L29
MKDTLSVMKMRNAPQAEIDARVLELKRSLMDRRFALKVGSVKDTSEIGKARRAIAALKGFATNKKAPAAAKSAAPSADKKKK